MLAAPAGSRAIRTQENAHGRTGTDALHSRSRKCRRHPLAPDRIFLTFPDRAAL